LQVATPGPTDIPTNVLTPSQALVYPLPAYNGTGNTPTVQSGYTTWITFLVSVPVDTTVQMQASFLMPSTGGIANLNAMDVRFGNSTGTNVLCTGANIDLKKAYNTTFFKTSSLTTFMQVLIRY
jgi:hypothetical protein